MSDAPAKSSSAESAGLAGNAGLRQSPASSPMNPYLAGIFLGLAVLAAFFILGSGFSVSEGLARLAAFIARHFSSAGAGTGVASGPIGPAPLTSYTFFMLLGLFAGALVSAVAGRRARFPSARGLAAPRRLLLILAGGLLAGFAISLAQGVLLDQMLHGGVLLVTGSFVFLICFLIAGYAAAWGFRKVLR